MPELKIIESEMLTLSKLNELVKPANKKDEINPIRQKIMDHTAKFSKLNKDKETKLVEELKALDIPRMTEEHIVTIVNILPKNINELKIVFAGTKTTIAIENLEKIKQLIGKYEK
jgi:DNA-directed RNA polymerase subunit F